MAGVQNKKPPVNMDLLGFKFPITAIVSIFHRVTGVLLFISIPLFIYLFHLSLRDEVGFITVTTLLQVPWMRFLSFFIVWSFMHHLFCGIRYLLMDLEIGVEKASSRYTSWLVLFATLISLLIYWVMLL